MSPRPTPGSQTSLREANEQRVLRALLRHGAQTQAELARTTGLSPATVSNIVRDLRATGTVDTTPTSKGGRRALSVTLSRGAGVVAGVDFGHSHLRVAVADLSHTVLAEDSRPMDVDASAEEGLTAAVDMIDRQLAKAGADREELLSIGMGIPGPVDVATGAVGSSAILPGWVGVVPGTVLSSRFDRPVFVDNDANLGALGEAAWGAGRGVLDMAYIKIATGVGAGLLLGGRLHRGSAGTAGEIGHSTIDENGSVCRCGNRGCLETFVGAPVLLDLLRRSHGELNLREMLALAVDGDAGCERVIADAARYIGVSVANLCNLLSPERVVVGGEMATAGELLLQPLRDTVRRFAIPSAAKAMTIVRGSLGERAEVLGAVALALRESDAFVADEALAALSVHN